MYKRSDSCVRVFGRDVKACSLWVFGSSLVLFGPFHREGLEEQTRAPFIVVDAHFFYFPSSCAYAICTSLRLIWDLLNQNLMGERAEIYDQSDHGVP